MGGGGVDDTHRRPGKNGHDQAQDREIRDINSRFESWEKTFSTFAKEDTETHLRIERSLQGLISDWTWSRRLAVFAIAICGALFGWGVQYLVATEARLDEVARESRDHIKEGMQIGRDLQRQASENRKDIQELQKLHIKEDYNALREK
jgi:hypothetical protein